MTFKYFSSAVNIFHPATSFVQFPHFLLINELQHLMFTVFDGPNQKVDEKKEQNNLLTLKVLDSSKLKMLNI